LPLFSRVFVFFFFPLANWIRHKVYPPLAGRGGKLLRAAEGGAVIWLHPRKNAHQTPAHRPIEGQIARLDELVLPVTPPVFLPLVNSMKKTSPPSIVGDDCAHFQQRRRVNLLHALPGSWVPHCGLFSRHGHALIVLRKVPQLSATGRTGTRHYGEVHRTFQSNRDVTEFGERLEVASRPAAKIEDFERRFIPNVLQK
jgi:hypothetical protein